MRKDTTHPQRVLLLASGDGYTEVYSPDKHVDLHVARVPFTGEIPDDAKALACALWMAPRRFRGLYRADWLVGVHDLGPVTPSEILAGLHRREMFDAIDAMGEALRQPQEGGRKRWAS